MSLPLTQVSKPVSMKPWMMSLTGLFCWKPFFSRESFFSTSRIRSYTGNIYIYRSGHPVLNYVGDYTHLELAMCLHTVYTKDNVLSCLS